MNNNNNKKQFSNDKAQEKKKKIEIKEKNKGAFLRTCLMSYLMLMLQLLLKSSIEVRIGSVLKWGKRRKRKKKVALDSPHVELTVYSPFNARDNQKKTSGLRKKKKRETEMYNGRESTMIITKKYTKKNEKESG